MGDDLIGFSELPGVLGVARTSAARYARRSDFPAPAEHLASGRVWRRSDVEQWKAAKLPLRTGRPPLVSFNVEGVPVTLHPQNVGQILEQLRAIGASRSRSAKASADLAARIESRGSATFEVAVGDDELLIRALEKVPTSRRGRDLQRLERTLRERIDR